MVGNNRAGVVTCPLFKPHKKQMTTSQRIEQKLDKIMKALAIDDEDVIISKKELAKNIRNSLLNQKNVRTRKN